ncbi:helix-turn-helix domain-containing protein [Gorillibacterium sp. CAU 1737]|uniref:helix-turn-helix domain-containing protein n=1 Tax=Gorillibacterium sp. CAU 1737 TaxID=3140362 RepID=UPI003260028D
MDIELLSECSTAIQRVISQRFLSDLIRKPARKNLTITDRERLSIPEECRSNAAIAILDTRTNREEPPEVESLREQLHVELEHQLGGRSVFLQAEEGLFICLFPANNSPHWERIQREASRYAPLTLSISIGERSKDLSLVHESYRQAVRLAHVVFSKGPGVYYAADHLPYQAEVEYPHSSQNEILVEMEENSLDGLKAAVHSFYEGLYEQGVIEIDLVYLMTIRLVISLEQALAKGGSERYALPLLDITKTEYRSELEEKVYGILNQLRELSLLAKPQEDGNIIERSIEHMKKDVANTSLQQVAAQVYVTPNYLSMLFKSRTGRTFIDTLTDLRMEEAKRRIAETGSKNFEISQDVGYQDPRYFSKLFKQKVGMTPSEYRERMGRSTLLVSRQLG